jgi:MFS family permease
VLFAAARSTAWLFGGPALQGLAVEMISGAATAALVELDPGDDRRRAALLAGLAQAGGSALGPLFAGALAQWAPASRQLCFVLTLAATVVAAVLIARLPKARGGDPEPWRIRWPRVPGEVERPFVRVSLTAAVVQATLALFLSIVPSSAGEILKTKNLALPAAIVALALLASSGAQIAAQRYTRAGRRGQAIGLVLLAAGLTTVVVAAPAGSLALLAAGAITAGAGHARVHQRPAGAERDRSGGAARRGDVRVHRVDLRRGRVLGDRHRRAQPPVLPVAVGRRRLDRPRRPRDRRRDLATPRARPAMSARRPPAVPRFPAFAGRERLR